MAEWPNKMILRGTQAGREWAQVWDIAAPTGSEDGQKQAFQAMLSWGVDIAPNTTDSVALLQVEVRYGDFNSFIQDGNQPGGLTGEELPPNNTAVIRKNTPGGFPPGRCYHPGLRASDVNDDGTLDPLWVVQLTTAYQGWYNSILSSPDPTTLGVHSERGGLTSVFNAIAPEDLTCRTLIGSQRRRLY